MLKSTLPLSFIVATRFFGLFIILPVFSVYAKNLDGANTFLIGIAIGIYALMQMVFQLPFGIMSDKFGRKNSILIGLIIFIVGSLVCALSSDIYTMIFGRLLQGCGAVGAVAIAMISDFVKEELRAKAMAIMGAMIGFGFTISLVVSPVLARFFGLASLFYLSALLTLFCIILLYTVVPAEPKISSIEKKSNIATLLKDRDLFLMNMTNFLQKMIMTIAFLAIPLILVNKMNYNIDKLWIVYSIAMCFGFVAMSFVGMFGEKQGLTKKILLFGIVLFVIAYLLFALSSSKLFFIVGVTIFFVGFSMHEPILQSSVSKFAKATQKGAVLGIFNGVGYFGSFCGGLIGGFFMHNYGIGWLSLFVIVMAFPWFYKLIFLTNPSLLKSFVCKKEKLDLKKLHNIKGFIESYKTGESYVIRYNSGLVTKEQLEEALRDER